MRRITLLLMIVVTCCFLAGCKKEGGTTPTPQTDTEKANEWIYSTMKTNYLWSDKLPTKDNSKLTTYTQTYFDVNLRYRANKSVTYANDTYGDRFSRLAKIEAGRSGITEMAATEMEYDFGFVPVYVSNSSGALIFLQVLYVVPGSPADIEGLQRGDAFEQISGQNLVSSQNTKSLLGQSTITLKILNRAGTPSITITKGSYYDNPVLHTEVFTAGGVKIGYLVYNHFTSADDLGAASYSTKLKNVFQEFKNDGVTKLILDLRYNGGGEVVNAQLLASLIIPNANLGKTWMYMERNVHKGDKSKFEEVTFLPSSEVGTIKPQNIDEVFFITSGGTASASELMIHSLRPFYTGKLHVVGLTTVGKNVGSREFKNEALGWVMNPITSRIYDKNKISGYETGIVPDQEEKEYWVSKSSPYPNYFTLAPFGDYEHEWLLNLLVGTYFGGYSASAPARFEATRGGVQDFKATADIRQRGLTEAPHRER